MTERDYIGVHKFRNRYRAQAMVNGVRRSLGVFDTAREAAIARDKFVADHTDEWSPHDLNADYFDDLPYPGERGHRQDSP